MGTCESLPSCSNYIQRWVISVHIVYKFGSRSGPHTSKPCQAMAAVQGTGNGEVVKKGLDWTLHASENDLKIAVVFRLSIRLPDRYTWFRIFECLQIGFASNNWEPFINVIYNSFFQLFPTISKAVWEMLSDYLDLSLLLASASHRAWTFLCQCLRYASTLPNQDLTSM